jgi:hypothetical protein
MAPVCRSVGLLAAGQRERLRPGVGVVEPGLPLAEEVDRVEQHQHGGRVGQAEIRDDGVDEAVGVLGGPLVDPLGGGRRAEVAPVQGGAEGAARERQKDGRQYITASAVIWITAGAVRTGGAGSSVE